MMEPQIKQRILVVDDDSEITMVVQSRLKKADYEVDIALNGREGLEKIKSFKPDLVVLDVIMGDMNGYEVCAEIKSKAQWRQIPVILLTSRMKILDERVGLACKADAYIRKPQCTELLIPTVKKLLANACPAGLGNEEKRYE